MRQTEIPDRPVRSRLSPRWAFDLGTPRDPARRGSHVSLRHPEGYRINRALIEEMGVIPDFREPDNIRLGIAPIYTTLHRHLGDRPAHRQVVVRRALPQLPAGAGRGDINCVCAGCGRLSRPQPAHDLISSESR